MRLNIYICMHAYIHRPFLWGPAALEQYKIRREVGWLLWKQPDTQEVVEQLDTELLLHSSENFPLYVQLEVNCMYTGYSTIVKGLKPSANFLLRTSLYLYVQLEVNCMSVHWVWHSLKVLPKKILGMRLYLRELIEHR